MRPDSNEWVATCDKGFMVCFSFSNSQSADGGLSVGINHANGSGEGATYAIGVGGILDGCIHGAPEESVKFTGSTLLGYVSMTISEDAVASLTFPEED